MGLTTEQTVELTELIRQAQDLYAQLPAHLDDDDRRHATWMEILNVQQRIDAALPPHTGPIGA